jgi:hypothetical protein
MNSVPHPFRDLCEKGGASQTPTGPANQESNSWRPRDFIAAALLFLGTAAFVCWQNSRVAVLWDLGYLLDTSWRIALGQMPYRDFPLVHGPLTFVLQAVLMRLAGRHYLVPVAYAVIAGAAGTVLTWRIVLRIVRGAAVFASAGWPVALMLAAPLTVLGVYSVYPHPIYDCDCALAILLALLLLTSLATPGKTAGSNWGLPVAAGAATVLPVFFKQNMGLPFLAAVGAGVLLLLVLEFLKSCSLRRALRSPSAFVLAGMASALFLGLAAIASTASVGDYFHWTVQFAAQRRLPGVALMLSVYREPSLTWMLPALGAGLALCCTRLVERRSARIAAMCLMAAPLAATLLFLLVQDDAEDRADNLLALWPLLLLAGCVVAVFELRRGVTLGRLVPFFVLAAIHGAFLSQQLWGSTYALWPLLMVLVAQTLAAMPARARPVVIRTAAILGAVFIICGGLYAVSLQRLSYIQIPDAPLEHSSVPALRGMADRGPYLPNFDELVDFTEREIPRADALLVLPGEDPFFYATGRIPQFPMTLFDPTTDPYSAPDLLAEARRRDVQWVIVKRVQQINGDPMPEKVQSMELIAAEYALYRRLGGYDIYRKR